MQLQILVPIDGSSHSFAGLVYAVVSFPNATITTLHVQASGQDVPSECDSPERDGEDQQPILARAIEIASAYNHDVNTALEGGEPHRAILEHIAEHDIDHVVMGSHGESPVESPFLGRVTEAVVRRSPISTTIIPESRPKLLRREFPGRILVPVDGSDQSLAAIEYTVDRFPDARITLFHAVAPSLVDEPATMDEGRGDLIDSLTRRGASLLDSAVQSIENDDIVVESVLEHGPPAQSILDYAIDNAFDQIIMGSHGRSLPARIIFGSVAETVSRRSTVPVTIIKDRPA